MLSDGDDILIETDLRPMRDKRRRNSEGLSTFVRESGSLLTTYWDVHHGLVSPIIRAPALTTQSGHDGPLRPAGKQLDVGSRVLPHTHMSRALATTDQPFLGDDNTDAE